MKPQTQKVIGWLTAGLLGYAGYRILFKKDNPIQAVEKVADLPEKAAQAVTKTTKAAAKSVKRLVKGSPEAKAHMAKLRTMQGKKSTKKKSGKTAHKGHATKRGLAQDQKLRSNEEHEKRYQQRRARMKK